MFILEILVFCKWVNLKNIFKKIEQRVSENETMSNFVPMIRLVIEVLLVAHFFALFYYITMKVEINQDYDNLWLSRTKKIID